MATRVLETTANVVAFGIGTAVISNFLSNVFISGTLNYLWGMINSLQIVAHFPLINILMPANCQVLFRVIVKIVTFDWIPIDGFMDSVEKIFKGKVDIELSDNFAEFQYETTDPIQNLQFNFVFLLSLMIVPVLIRLVELVVMEYEEGTYRVQEFKRRHIYWNMFLRFFLQAYLELAITGFIRVKAYSYDSWPDTFLTIFAIGIVLLIATYMIGSVLFLR